MLVYHDTSLTELVRISASEASCYFAAYSLGRSFALPISNGLFHLQVLKEICRERKQLEDEVIFAKESSALFSGGTGTHTQLCHVAWGSSLVYIYLTAHFCTQKFKVMINPLLSLSPSSFLLLIYILLNDEIIQYIIPQQLCCLKKKWEWSN